VLGWEPQAALDDDRDGRRNGSMASRRNRETLIRQWQLISALAKHRRGLTLPELAEVAGVSRATVYRYLALLSESGVPLTAEGRHQGARHRLLAAGELPALGLTTLQIAALSLARQVLDPLTGTELIAELDALIAKLRPVERQLSLRLAPQAKASPGILGVVDAAQRSGRRARIEYRAASRGGKPSTAHIEPLEVRLIRGEPYVRAFCVERNAERTYKLSRIAEIELSHQPATHRVRSHDDPFARSLKAWSGDPVTISVVLDASVAWLASEYALPGQRVTTRADGSALVEADVSGLVEVTRWVLGWGDKAEAVHPPAFRDAVRRELAGSAARYRSRPGPAKARAAQIDRATVKQSHGS
jgi:predicted DNA-binding transcriptional regulator YafY